MSDEKNPVHLILKQVRIIWAIYSAASLFLLFVARQLTVNRTSPPADIFGWAAPACIVLSVASIIIAMVIFRTLPRRMLSPWPALHNRFLKHPSIGDEDRQAAMVASSAGKITIILSAYSMSCATYGLIIVILGGELWNMIPFVVVSLVLQAIFWPSKAFLRRVEEKLGVGQQGNMK